MYSDSPDSAVDIAARYGLEDREFGVRVPVVSSIFSMSSRPVLGVHPASNSMRIRGIKQPRREADHILLTSAEVKKIWSFAYTPPYVFMAEQI
jgi:hypothetical protein